MAHSTQKRAAARRAFENDGESLNSIANRLGVSRTTLSKWRKADGWVALGEQAAALVDPEPEPEPEINEPEPEPAPARADEQTSTELTVEELLRTELDEAKAKLARYEPTEVEWPVDEETAMRLLADDIDDRIASELEDVNRERLKRGIAPVDADALGPAWKEQQTRKIIRDAVDSLTRWAQGEGPSPRTLAMLKPDGVTRVKVPLSDGINNYGLSPDGYMAKLKAKGFVELTPRRCWRQDCWAEGVEAFQGYCSEAHLILDPYRDVDPTANLATTTATFDM